MQKGDCAPPSDFPTNAARIRARTLQPRARAKNTRARDDQSAYAKISPSAVSIKKAKITILALFDTLKN